jgi:hypothetical protein
MSSMDGLSAIWTDLTTEPDWKYDELPPFMLSQLTENDLFEASDSELARVIWFWCRRPKLMFHDSAVLVIVRRCESGAIAVNPRPLKQGIKVSERNSNK